MLLQFLKFNAPRRPFRTLIKGMYKIFGAVLCAVFYDLVHDDVWADGWSSYQGFYSLGTAI
jgi:hypothetical protein